MKAHQGLTPTELLTRLSGGTLHDILRVEGDDVKKNRTASDARVPKREWQYLRTHSERVVHDLLGLFDYVLQMGLVFEALSVDLVDVFRT